MRGAAGTVGKRWSWPNQNAEPGHPYMSQHGTHVKIIAQTGGPCPIDVELRCSNKLQRGGLWWFLLSEQRKDLFLLSVDPLPLAIIISSRTVVLKSLLLMDVFLLNQTDIVHKTFVDRKAVN